MIKDIDFGETKKVSIAIIKETIEDYTDWKVYLINENDFELHTVLVTSRGYGEIEKEKINTSTLRHYIEKVAPNCLHPIETIQEEVFKITNEYWVSFYIGDKILDKKYIFLPESIVEENLTSIPFTTNKGILHP